ncbi:MULTISPECIES: Na+/H+ antiporter NhaA [unclassified Leifsonia]|uniref:Na+/H+ antiporter NhaA n=1 Tax=unclassified Leifsonia TaxID=2663824 RepID=UPI0008A7DA3F|nr:MULTISPECIES: Na+/H+ antiporter NhaA [unclassified Leifsonia]SEI03835.1 sodium/proton antiporter, NhaA family [Leifsonia sp. CL154]SFL73575.1 sodium/proton antiporter, NhaA family [Leifsonia sp. CL147]
MSIIRSERTAAGLLLGAAALGLLLANTPVGPGLLDLQHSRLGGGALALSVGHWISDGLLAIFFFIVAVELKHELVAGELNSVQKAIHPAIAAVAGVIVPAGLYLAVTAGTGQQQGWPIPTATDIAFALGVLAVFGRGLPNRLRVFLLALAVLDDLIAILIIAIFFTTNPNVLELVLAAITVALFGVLSRMLRGRLRWPLGVLMVLLALLSWWLVHDSGVHATIAGVALGLAMARRPAGRVTHALEPWSNAVVLPLFAFSAALVPIPSVAPSQLSPAFWAILVALPVGKLVGITLGGWLGSFAGRRQDRGRISPFALLTVAALGGIGFTVSLLMNELAFAGSAEVRAEGTLAVLLGSGVAIVVSGILVSALARRNRRLHPHPHA